MTKSVSGPDIIYIQTTFQRRGNLNGRECILGELETFLEYSRPGDLIVKVDPDTLFLDRDYMRGLVFSGRLHAVVRTASSVFGGYFYMLSRDLVMRVLQAVESLELGYMCGEDAVIGSLAYALAPKPVHYLIDNAAQGGPSGSFNYHLDDWDGYWRDALDKSIALMTVSEPGLSKETELKIQTFLLNKIMGGNTDV